MLSFLNILNDINIEKYIQNVAKINQLLLPMDVKPIVDNKIVLIS